MENINLNELTFLLNTSKSLTEVLKKLGKKNNGGNFRLLKKIMKENDLIFLNEKNSKEKYEKSPKKCLCCGKILDYEHRYNKYCSKSCAATENNKKFPKKAKLFKKNNYPENRTYKENDLHCIVCGKQLTGNQKKYCSKKCKSMMYSHTKYHTKYSKQKDENGLKTKLFYIKKLGGECSICGYDKNLSALTFHHLRDKSFTLDSRTFERCPKELLEKELEKCILVCQNCHHEIHHPQYNRENLEDK